MSIFLPLYYGNTEDRVRTEYAPSTRGGWVENGESATSLDTKGVKWYSYLNGRREGDYGKHEVRGAQLQRSGSFDPQPLF